MFSPIRSVLTKFKISDTPILLGRWNLDYCQVVLDRKVTLSNEDNCGICYSNQFQNMIIRNQQEEDIFHSMITELYT